MVSVLGAGHGRPVLLWHNLHVRAERQCARLYPLLGDDGKSLLQPDRVLGEQVFGKWDIVLSYDLSRGLRAMAGSDAKRLQGMMQFLTARWGEPITWPREPDKLLLGLDAFIERNLVEEPGKRKSVAIVFDYAQYLVPAGDLDALARGNASRLVRFLAWRRIRTSSV